MSLDVDTALSAVGAFGLHQKASFAVLCAPAAVAAFVTMANVFITYTMKHRCFVSGCDSNLASEYRDRYPDAMDPAKGSFYKFAFPPSEQDVIDQCNMFVEQNNSMSCSAELYWGNETSRCEDGWLYDEASAASTAVSEFNLVCHNDWKVPLVEFVFFFGVLLAAVTLGSLSDRFGRRHVLMWSVGLMCAAGIAMAAAQSYTTFVIMQFLAAFGQLGSFQTAFVLSVENVGSEWRVFCGIVIEYFFVLGEIVLAFVAWQTPTWRSMLLWVLCPASALLLLWPLCPESVRWLASKGHVHRLQHQLDVFARVNRTDRVDVNQLIGEQQASQQSSAASGRSAQPGSALQLLRHRVLLVRSAVVCYSWLVVAMTYYGISMHSGSALAGDRHLNFMLLAMAEIPGYAVSHFAMQRFGRRPTMCWSLGLCSVALTLSAVASALAWPWQVGLVAFLAGKTAVTCAFGTVYLYTSELYPTPIRTLGVGLSSMVGRVGAMASPYVALMAHWAVWVPAAAFAAAALLAAALVALLPETLGCELPDSVEAALALGLGHQHDVDVEDETDGVDHVDERTPLLAS